MLIYRNFKQIHFCIFKNGAVNLSSCPPFFFFYVFHISISPSHFFQYFILSFSNYIQWCFPCHICFQFLFSFSVTPNLNLFSFLFTSHFSVTLLTTSYFEEISFYFQFCLLKNFATGFETIANVVKYKQWKVHYNCLSIKVQLRGKKKRKKGGKQRGRRKEIEKKKKNKNE